MFWEDADKTFLEERDDNMALKHTEKCMWSGILVPESGDFSGVSIPISDPANTEQYWFLKNNIKILYFNIS